MPRLPTSNFAFLQPHDEQLARLGLLAEKYLLEDPNTSLIKLRQYGELLAQTVSAQMEMYSADPQESQYELLQRLRMDNVLTDEIYQLFNEVRRAGNDATHNGGGDSARALNTLKYAWQLGVWFERTFYLHDFNSAEFFTPVLRDESAALREELERLASETASARAALAEQQNAAERKQTRTFEKYRAAAQSASQQVLLDEPATRQMIDDQLTQAGWEADSVNLRYASGARPERGRNLAIAEWPTASGPADYVLFIGLTPIAVVEAKRKNKDVSASLVQAKRYSRDFFLTDDMQSPGGPWNEYRIPFVFSTNGRPYLRQLETLSGIWFGDLRQATNLSHALEDWYTPLGLRELLKRDQQAAERQLQREEFNYGFALRDYQQQAILAVEKVLAQGQRAMLIAMATGTGKTKTCIALIYRLLKVQRFRRVLFLVDREALGEQAADAFKDTRMDGLQSFANIFGIKELGELAEDATKLQIATVQGMLRQVLYPSENAAPLAVDAFDCIVVDECHRGYLLDRELSNTELTFRSFDDYVSKYRRVIEYFDAVKIGLTATPALHTTQIFGMPVYTYSYREAVIDGYLVDHEPPVQIKTRLSENGITWQAGDQVEALDPRRGQLSLFTTPDQIHLDVEAFNRQVITKEFNEVVCKFLAREIDPYSRQKTLIFCARDSHADMVVDLLKKACQAQYGGVEDDAILKITGSVDQPMSLIRRFKNEKNPTIAVTVDLLTTGIDVPEICNLVFLRRVNSRILFDQMLGRATRLCPEVEKEVFHIFDAVRLYEILGQLTDMKPVVVDPHISFSQLAAELSVVPDEAGQQLIREQLLAKFQRKKNRLNEKNASDFETVAGMSAQAFGQKLSRMSPAEVADWFVHNPLLAEILDRVNESGGPILVSHLADELTSAGRDYGQVQKPGDYLESFKTYLATHRDEVPALLTVMTRPRDLTRKQLKQLALELDRAGFSEANLATAWRETTNQQIATHIVGFIRHLAVGDPLVPYEQRVEWALQQMLAARAWSTPQRQWLLRIAAQTRANIVVDREALDDPDLIFRREGGGFARLDRMFDGHLTETLDQFHELLWKQEA